MLSLLYRAGLAIDRRLTRPLRLPVPVISVGNIASGGRAKTPFVVEICRGLVARGHEAVVLTRGYGRTGRGSVWLMPGETEARADEAGDEALEILMRAEVPVLVGADRAANAQRWLRERSGAAGAVTADSSSRFGSSRVVFVLDDGFQHWKLERDFDLVLVEAADYRDGLLPLGRLREEPVALRRANLVLERGRDFGKIPRLVGPQSPAPPDPARGGGKGALALTTRAPEADYQDFIKALPFETKLIELRDHATAREIHAAIAGTSAETLLLGGKEAVKLLAPTDLRAFFASGRGRLDAGSRSLQLRFVDLGLSIRDPEGLWQSLESALGRRAPGPR